MEIPKTLTELTKAETINHKGGSIPSWDDALDLFYRLGKKVGHFYRDLFDAVRGFIHGVECAIDEEIKQ